MTSLTRNISYILLAMSLITCKRYTSDIVLVGWGDSMLKGSGGEHSIIEVMADKLNIKHANYAVGGLSSESVAVLQGAIPLKVLVSNKIIKKNVSTKLDYYSAEPFNFLSEPYRNGKLAGIEGKLKRVFNEKDKRKTLGFEFEPKHLKEDITVNDTLVFTFDDAFIKDRTITIIWAGRNDKKDSINALKTVSNIKAMVNNLPESSKDKYLILSVCNGISSREGRGTKAHAQIQALNNLLATTFTNHFVDIRSYLMHQAIYDLGEVPTYEDKMDIAKD